jgi:hypothetical protein
MRELTVGPSKADVLGLDDDAVQTALDAVAFAGGGSVHLLAGEYILQNAVRLHSNIRLSGVPGKTVLRMGPPAWSALAVDADIGEREITPADSSPFRVGMGVCLRDAEKPHVMSNAPLAVIRIADGTLYTNDYIVHDFSAESEGTVVSYHPLVWVRGAHNVEISDLVLDGQPEDPHGLEAIRSSTLCLERCEDVRVQRVHARRCQGDGICCITSRKVSIEECEAEGNVEYGVHLGSHSPECRVSGCRIHHNGADGLYLCWGVRRGEFTENGIHHNGHIKIRSGISIGHKDTDNLISGNHIFRNFKHGIAFREKTEANGAHRNVLRRNTIEDNGSAGSPGCGIYVSGVTHDILLERNTVRRTAGRKTHQQNGLYLAAGVSRVQMRGNRMSGHPGAAVVDESGSPENDLQAL